MTVVPSLMLIFMMAALSFNAIFILRKRWMKIVAACCCGVEIVFAISLITAVGFI